MPPKSELEWNTNYIPIGEIKKVTLEKDEPATFECTMSFDPSSDGFITLFGANTDFKKMLKPKKVIYNDPATIVIWADGEKTVVKCKEGERFDCWTGFAMCICKRILGDEFHPFFKRWTGGFGNYNEELEGGKIV